MNTYLAIGEAASLLGVSIPTLRRWERAGYLVPGFRTPGGHRRYRYEQIAQLADGESAPIRRTKIVGYARVSSADQKPDLERQCQEVAAACRQRSQDYEVISDLGSGINYQKKGLQRLLRMILAGEVHELILTHRDRLLRFGSQLLFEICRFHGTRIIVLHDQQEQDFEQQLAKDVVEIITVFTSRVYGRRAQENRRRRLAS